MPTIKIACPDCGQRVSGDESFLGKSVKCPVCESLIPFPASFEDLPEPATAAAQPPPLPDAAHSPQTQAPDADIPSPPSEHIHLLPSQSPTAAPPDTAPTVVKIACRECGQRVSGDDSFLGTTVPCPNCGTDIVFPVKAPGSSPDDSSSSQVGKLNVVSVEKPKLKHPDDDEDEDEDDEFKGEEKIAPAPKTARKKAPPQSLPRPSAPKSAAPSAGTAPGARVSKVAVSSLVFGLLSLVLFPVGIGLLFVLPALVFGHAARGRIKSSGGRLLGKGLATTGLFFTYLVVFLTVAALATAIAFKGKDRAVQTYNLSQAPKVLEALNAYAETHQGRYPATLEDLIPDYIPREQKHLVEWIAPSGFEPVPYLYYPGHDLLIDDQATIIIAAPEPDALNRRLVGYLSTDAALIGDEEFLNAMAGDEEDE
jgi:hypothetical protein